MEAPPHEGGEGDASISDGSRAPPSRPISDDNSTPGKLGVPWPPSLGGASPPRLCAGAGRLGVAGIPPYWLAAPPRRGQRSSMAAGTPPHKVGDGPGGREGARGEEQCGACGGVVGAWGEEQACRRRQVRSSGHGASGEERVEEKTREEIR